MYFNKKYITKLKIIELVDIRTKYYNSHVLHKIELHIHSENI